MGIFEHLFKSSDSKKNNKKEEESNKDIFKELISETRPKPVSDEDLEEISYYDDFGKERKMKKKEWKEKKLIPSIKRNWDNVEGLYPIVLDCFSKGMYEEVQEACLRIYALDENVERRVNLLGRYNLEIGDYEQAKKIYAKSLFFEKINSEVLFNGYAEALEKLGDESNQVEGAYLKALEINPNSAIAFKKYFNIVKARSTYEYESKLDKLSSIQGNWRAKLTEAVNFFKKGDKEKGNYFLTTALRESDYSLEVMSVASAIYGMNDLYEEFEQYVLPYYNPEKHGVQTALNVLKYYEKKGKYKEGLELCRFCSKFNWLEYHKKFQKYEDGFYELKVQEENQGKEEKKSAVKFYPTSLPLWYGEFNKPHWLTNNNKRRKPNLLVLLFTIIGEKTEMSEELSSSLPLYLNEVLHYKSVLNYQVAVSHEEGKLVIPNKRYSIDYMNLIKKQNPNLDYVLSGNILKLPGSNEKYEIEVYLYDCFNETKIRLVNKIYSKENLYEIQNDMVVEFNEFFNCMKQEYIKLEKDMGNLLLYKRKIEFLLEDKKIKNYQSWKYKKLLADQIDVVLNDRKNDLKKINLISLLYEIKKNQSQLLKSQKPLIYNMNIYGLFETPTLKLLAPIIFKIFDDNENYEANIEALNQNSPIYVEWLSKFSDIVVDED